MSGRLPLVAGCLCVCDGVCVQLLLLFRHLQGKDLFEAFYKKHLAKRLLLGTPLVAVYFLRTLSCDLPFRSPLFFPATALVWSYLCMVLVGCPGKSASSDNEKSMIGRMRLVCFEWSGVHASVCLTLFHCRCRSAELTTQPSWRACSQTWIWLAL